MEKGRIPIIAGTYKSRALTVPSGIRPVSLRVKKACFDLLGGDFEGMTILDLFAGSGSLGIEALSRGATSAVFVDSSKRCVDTIRANITAIAADQEAVVYLKDGYEALRQLSGQKTKFDAVFLDPPYYKGMVTKALQALAEYDIVARFGFIIGFCYQKDDFSAPDKSFELLTDRTYGQTTIAIYQKKEHS